MSTTMTQYKKAEARAEAQGRELAEIRTQLGMITGDKPGAVISATDAIGTALQMVADNPSQTRALADVIGTGTGNAEGLVYNQFVSELLGGIERLRPLFSAAGTVAFPTTGYGLTFPRRTQSTLVAKRTGEKTEAASRELTITQGEYLTEWFAGAVDVSFELIAQSDPSVLEVIGQDLLDQYALATETEFAADTVAAATAQGAVLPVATWGALIAAVMTTSQDIRTATGRAGDRLALTTASWQAVLSLLNPSAPAALPGSAPGLTSDSVNVGGVLTFHAPTITADVQFNEVALRKAEKPPFEVSANNPALMGRDIGIIGATIFLPLHPAGIIKYTA
jgi:HK97 family phage major capsid protein